MFSRLFRKEELDDAGCQERISRILVINRVMTLATTDSQGIWTAPVFFANDDYDLIWVSSPSSRHSKAIASNPAVATSVYNSKSEWQKIQGLQIEGTAEAPEDKETIRELRDIYTRKFPFTGKFFNEQRNLPPELRERIQDVRFYRLRPHRIVLVDNTVHFGFNYEYRLQD